MLGLMGFSGSLPLYVIHRYYIFVFIGRANKDACLLAWTFRHLDVSRLWTFRYQDVTSLGVSPPDDKELQYHSITVSQTTNFQKGAKRPGGKLANSETSCYHWYYSVDRLFVRCIIFVDDYYSVKILKALSNYFSSFLHV